MIITRQKSAEEILRILEVSGRIFIVGCDDCAAACKTGGEPEIKKMTEFLKAHGKEVTGTALPETTCVAARLKSSLAKSRQALEKAEAVLVLACGSGVQCVKDNDRYNLEVYPGCDSLFAAAVDKDGIFQEVCSSCGECVLDLTEGVCPVTRCPKGILNGPCGGSIHGKCEVDKDRDCAWILIYKRLKDKGALSRLKKRLPAKNYAKSLKPGRLAL